MATKYENSGTLSRNEKKEKDNQPDHRGSANIDGVEYWISAWVREGRNGKFFSMAFERKDSQSRGNTQQREPSPQSGLDDDIPF